MSKNQSQRLIYSDFLQCLITRQQSLPLTPRDRDAVEAFIGLDMLRLDVGVRRWCICYISDSDGSIYCLRQFY